MTCILNNENGQQNLYTENFHGHQRGSQEWGCGDLHAPIYPVDLEVFWHWNIFLICAVMMKVCQPNVLWIWLNWFWQRTISFLRRNFIYKLRAQQWVPLWPLTMQTYILAILKINISLIIILWSIIWYCLKDILMTVSSFTKVLLVISKFLPYIWIVLGHSIKFTYHVGTTEMIFLDTNISVINGQLVSSLYRKETAKKQSFTCKECSSHVFETWSAV